MESLKIAIALRAARTALGWNQQEFADRMGVAKSTIARIETLEMGAKAEFLTQALRIFQNAGIAINFLQAEQIGFTISIQGLTEAANRLRDESMRRSDRKTKASVTQGANARQVRAKKQDGA